MGLTGPNIGRGAYQDRPRRDWPRAYPDDHDVITNNHIVRGRVLLAIAFRYYASGKRGQVLYDMNHLQSLKMKDNNLGSFHNMWNMAMSELAFVPDPVTLLFWYYNQLKDPKPMSEDIGHYRRSQWNNSPDYSFEWLWAASCRYIPYDKGGLNAGCS